MVKISIILQLDQKFRTPSLIKMNNLLENPNIAFSLKPYLNDIWRLNHGIDKPRKHEIPKKIHVNNTSNNFNRCNMHWSHTAYISEEK